MLVGLKERLARFRLALHEEKTRLNSTGSRRMTTVTLGKSRVRGSRTLGSARAKPDGSATRP